MFFTYSEARSGRYDEYSISLFLLPVLPSSVIFQQISNASGIIINPSNPISYQLCPSVQSTLFSQSRSSVNISANPDSSSGWPIVSGTAALRCSISCGYWSDESGVVVVWGCGAWRHCCCWFGRGGSKTVSMILLITLLNLLWSCALLSVGRIQLRKAMNIVRVWMTSERESWVGGWTTVLLLLLPPPLLMEYDAVVVEIGSARLLARRSSMQRIPTLGIPYETI